MNEKNTTTTTIQTNEIRERESVCVLENLIRRERDKQILSKTQIRVRVLNFIQISAQIQIYRQFCLVATIAFFFTPTLFFSFTPLSTNLQHGI